MQRSSIDEYAGLRDLDNTIVTYRVVFFMYQYNTGSGNNGSVPCIEEFSDLTDAKLFLGMVSDTISDKRRTKFTREEAIERLLELGYDGPITQVEGLYEIRKCRIG